MTNTRTVLGIALAVAACGGGKQHFDHKAVDRIVATIEACKDPACVAAAQNELASIVGGAKDLTSDEQAQMFAAGRVMDAKIKSLTPAGAGAAAPATPPAGDRISRVELFDAIAFGACLSTFVPTNLDAKGTAIMAKKTQQLEADAAKLGAALPPPVVATGNEIQDKTARMMRVMAITQSFFKGMEKTYPQEDMALVSLASDVCVLSAVYHPNDPVVGTYVTFIEKHTRFAKLDPALPAPLLAKVASNPPNIDDASLDFIQAVEKAVGH